jgi:hypothetical protein
MRNGAEPARIEEVWEPNKHSCTTIEAALYRTPAKCSGRRQAMTQIESGLEVRKFYKKACQRRGQGSRKFTRAHASVDYYSPLKDRVRDEHEGARSMVLPLPTRSISSTMKIFVVAARSTHSIAPHQ